MPCAGYASDGERQGFEELIVLALELLSATAGERPTTIRVRLGSSRAAFVSSVSVSRYVCLFVGVLSVLL